LVHALWPDHPVGARRGRRDVVSAGGAGEAPRPTQLGRPTQADLAAAVRDARTVPDLLGPGLDVVFCGINPGRWSGAVGHHFAHPGNRFWKAVHAAGFTDEILAPATGHRLLAAGVGITNLVRRTTASADELGPDELRQGAARLERTVRRLAPKAVAFLGIGAYRTGFGRPRAGLGRQPDDLGPAQVWVLANPSGLQARYGFDDLVAQLAELRREVGVEG
jgi:TDG/mug DNA glycosylase family protein